MKMEKQNLCINAKQELLGGEYQEVNISGVGHITNDLTCHALKVSGSAVIDGKVRCEDIQVSGRVQLNQEVTTLSDVRISGRATIAQNMIGNEMQVSGSLKAEKELVVQSLRVSGHAKSASLKANRVKVSGSLSVSESMRVDELEISGWLKVSKNIEAEKVKVMGRVNCDGFMNADDVELESMAGSSFKDMGASKVKLIRYQSGHPINQVLSSLIQTVAGSFSPIKKVIGHSIEADDIYVEYAKIQKIRGHHVVIGPECEVDEVEYSGTLEVSEKSSVKHQVKR